MGYTIKQKIEICLKSESNPSMTQSDLAKWAQAQYNSKQPSQTTISRILSNKNELIASKETDFQLVRRRKRLNPILRQILTEWVTQSIWEKIPITTPILQTTANSIWTRLPLDVKDGNGIFNQKWCNQFMKKLNIDLTGDDDDIKSNLGYKLNKIWFLDEKLELKTYLDDLIQKYDYKPQDVFTIDEFQLFYSLPLDQIFDINSVDKGLKQSSSSTENSLTVMLGTNLDGSEKLTPLIVGKNDKFDVSESSFNVLKNYHPHSSSATNHELLTLMNKLTEVYHIFYKNNINKWITSTMFHNYLLTLDHKLASSPKPRKILIIVDDSSSHRILNLKFNNLKLIYLKNNTNHKSPFNSLYNGVNFDYCPMNFGIVHEFKILYRLQQYLEMINRQRNPKVDPEPITLSNLKMNNSSTDVLSESDYNVPVIKAIEWIKRSWDKLSPQVILSSWRKTHLINVSKSWPQDDNINLMLASLTNVDLTVNYEFLNKVINHLNVVIPWQIDELLGLVNERGKATLNYISIEEIVTSCLSENTVDTSNVAESLNDNWMMNQMLTSSTLPESYLFDKPIPKELSTSQTPQILTQPSIPSLPVKDLELNNMSISALLAAADEMKHDEKLTQLPNIPAPNESQVLKRKLGDIDDVNISKRLNLDTASSINDSLPSSSTPSPYTGAMGSTPLFTKKLYSGITYKSYNKYGPIDDKVLIKSIGRLLEANGDQINLTDSTAYELRNQLKSLTKRLGEGKPASN